MDDKYLKIWKDSGQSDELIAKKLSITPDEVRRRYELIRQVQAAAPVVGADKLQSQFNVLCLQYNLLGESLKKVAENLYNHASPQEIKAKLDMGSAEESVKSLMSSFIILHPWKDPDSDLIEEAEKN